MEKESHLHSKLLQLLIFFYSPACSLYAGEFLYPVIADHKQSMLYLLYQKASNHIELWGWNPDSGSAHQLLFSRLTPAGLRLLPDGRSFSFVDQGQLKVKQLIKRSPRTIEFDAPLYNVELVHWIDAQSCYTHGKYNDRFGIFHVTIDGEVSPLCMADTIDNLYPQKVGTELFYIARNERWQYQIAKTTYEVPPTLDTFQERCAWYREQRKHSETIMDFGERPIIFLRMTNEREGFVIGHDQTMSRRDRVVKLSYYRISEEDGNWRAEHLFQFTIPSRFLFLGKHDRLYEALLPLLPRHIGGSIFYVDTIDKELALCQYDMGNSVSKQILVAPGQSLFVPVLWKGQLLSGGALGEQIRMESDDGGVQVRLVEVPN